MKTLSQIKKMSKEELIKAIDEAEGMQTLFTANNKSSLINKYIDLQNKGLIK